MTKEQISERGKAMENKCKCPICKKNNLVYPTTIGSYVCLRCSCIFDNKTAK